MNRQGWFDWGGCGPGSSRNNCGHWKEAPRLTLPPAPARTPKLLLDAADRVAEIYHSAHKWPVFAAWSKLMIRGTKRRNRHPRSERREAMVLAFSAAMRYCDLSESEVSADGGKGNRIGVPLADGRYFEIGIPRLAEMCGMTTRRTTRAIKSLIAIGLLKETARTAKHKSAAGRGFPFVRWIPRRAFHMLGLGAAHLKQLRYHAQRAIKKIRPPRLEAAKARSLEAMHMVLTALPGRRGFGGSRAPP